MKRVLPAPVAAVLLWWAAAAAPLAAQERVGLRTSVGMFAPVQAFVVTANATDPDVTLDASVAVRAELDYRYTEAVTFFLGIDHARTRMAHTSALQLSGPARSYSQVALTVPTAGVVYTVPALGPSVSPTLRLGGGMKLYRFDIVEITQGVRDLTLDVGIGLIADVPERVSLTAEVRWLGSRFDHAYLPLRQRSARKQALNDWIFQVGVRFGLSGVAPESAASGSAR